MYADMRIDDAHIYIKLRRACVHACMNRRVKQIQCVQCVQACKQHTRNASYYAIAHAPQLHLDTHSSKMFDDNNNA